MRIRYNTSTSENELLSILEKETKHGVVVISMDEAKEILEIVDRLDDELQASNEC